MKGDVLATKKRSLAPLYLILLSCIIPVVAAVLLYYVPGLRPAGATNYGSFVTPQRTMPSAAELPLSSLDGSPFDLESLKGRWVLVSTDGGACPDSCATKLHYTRNAHASQGKNVERLVRVWFVTDNETIPQKVLDAYKGTLMLRADPVVLSAFLLGPDVRVDVAGLEQEMDKYLWIIDPLGNLIMYYPGQETDPVRFRNDIAKLLHVSVIG
ncbi:SCO family protein [Advenella sp. RU8]|uniref:SCO family protein n=1 Tax=Advenella sp. RU8 TaxID=3399575 RepID=UPI003AAC564D